MRRHSGPGRTRMVELDPEPLGAAYAKIVSNTQNGPDAIKSPSR